MVGAVRGARRIANAIFVWCIHVGEILLVVTMGRGCCLSIVDLAVGICVGKRGRSEVMRADIVRNVTSASGVFVVFLKVVVA